MKLLERFWLWLFLLNLFLSGVVLVWIAAKSWMAALGLVIGAIVMVCVAMGRCRLGIHQYFRKGAGHELKCFRCGYPISKVYRAGPVQTSDGKWP